MWYSHIPIFVEFDASSNITVREKILSHLILLGYWCLATAKCCKWEIVRIFQGAFMPNQNPKKKNIQRHIIERKQTNKGTHTILFGGKTLLKVSSKVNEREQNYRWHIFENRDLSIEEFTYNRKRVQNGRNKILRIEIVRLLCV